MKKKAYFRFYEELNDFLPHHKRKKNFEYHFWGSPSVKDAIQALGVPHTEVDLILVNSSPVDFTYHLQAEDQISVYPIFESLDISAINPLRSKPLRRLKFILDVHLGKLSRYLRMLGFDTLYDNQFSDEEIMRIAREEKRIILTCDLEILKNNAVTHGYYLKSQHPREQIKEVIQRFDLTAHMQPFSRCMDCNGKLENVEKQVIIEHLEVQIRKDFEEFYRCTKCGKIYWKGSHYERMLTMIDNLIIS